MKAIEMDITVSTEGRASLEFACLQTFLPGFIAPSLSSKSS